MDLLHRFAQAPKPLWMRRILRSLILLVLPKTIEFHGYQLALNPTDHVMGSALLRGRYEPFGTKLFLEKLSPGRTVIDCGANIGIYTCLASGIVGQNGKVFSFEPEPRNFSCLTETIRLNHLVNVQPECVALSDQDGTASLHLSDMNMGDHRLGPADESRKSVQISTRRLDSYWNQAIPSIDILKLDVQGAEGLVFKGMTQTILQSKNLKVFMEFWPYGLRRCGTDPRELLDDLVSLGFSVQLIDQDAGSLRHLESFDELLAVEAEEISFDLYLERTPQSV